MFQRNLDIREAKGNIPFWFIAEKLGVHENTLRNWLKKELEPAEKEKVMNVIKDIKHEIKEGMKAK